MRCMNCQTEIPPQFRGAIMTNQCPGCSQNIYNDSVRELFSELSQAMEQMPNDPHGLAGWLLSNYQLIKIGTGEPVQEFYGTNPGKKVKKGKKTDDAIVNEFFERAGVPPIKKSNKTKKVANAILAEINKNMYGDEDIEIEEEHIEEEHNEEEELDLESKINNTLVDSSGGNPLNDYEQEELVNAFETSNEIDVLEMDRLARLERQKNSTGGFRRR